MPEISNFDLDLLYADRGRNVFFRRKLAEILDVRNRSMHVSALRLQLELEATTASGPLPVELQLEVERSANELFTTSTYVVLGSSFKVSL